MRVLIADDNQRVRCGMASLLAGAGDLEVCGEASESGEILQKAAELRPDVVLLDVNMPGVNGLETAQLLKQKLPALKILMVSQHDQKQLLPRALEAGALGCIDKSRIGTDLLPTLMNLFKA